jgi:hypothetical protein
MRLLEISVLANAESVPASLVVKNRFVHGFVIARRLLHGANNIASGVKQHGRLCTRRTGNSRHYNYRLDH